MSSAPNAFLTDGGQTGELIRSIDWSKTPIGAVATWSPALRMMVQLLLANRFPLLLWWGPSYCQIYNDALQPMLGDKHPASMGQSAPECFPEIWGIVGPLIDTPFKGGDATWMDELGLEYTRSGYLEETHFTAAYSPVPDESVTSGIGGVLLTVCEITDRVVGERRSLVLRDLGSRCGEAKTAEEACRIAAGSFTSDPRDIPFALVYLLSADQKLAQLAGAAGIEMGKPDSPLEVDLSQGITREGPWPLAETAASEAMRIVEDLAGKLGAVPPGPWSDPPRWAIVCPIRSNTAHQLSGLLVLGLSSRRPFDDGYRDFCELVASQVATAIANARAHEEERKRAEALAEINRAKTAFFNNVSHEFRTPLTLMLGPLEDELNLTGSERLAIAHRNSLRVLKLVNTLLDFARIEAGRIEAVYKPTELAGATSELASVFRSAIEKAGLKLIVDCPPLSEAVYVDTQMWEKIVLNLLSNAFKFTFEGKIEVSLRLHSGYIELRVADTGVGIPAEELPHVFERFYRVRTTRSRTLEGTGIGLALVQELVIIHGGAIQVQSVEGEGTTFRVTVPTGSTHLPGERLGAERSLASAASGAISFVEEALRWLPKNASEPVPGLRPAGSTAPVVRSLKRILFADDNADMRNYVGRLLSKEYEVETVADGLAAFERAKANPPDLVLADVMMPGLDGFGLLERLRTEERTQGVPFIMLSARDGEGARVEGLAEGADDYLVKPFSAQELLARVRTHVKMARLRRTAEVALRESEQRFRELADSAPVMIWITDDHGSIEFANRTYLNYFGVALKDITGQRWKDIVHPDDHGLYGRQFLADSIVGRPFRAECRARRADGQWRWIDSWAVPRSVESGDLPGMIGCSVDITERKGAEERIRELGSIVESSDDAIFGATIEGVITRWNKGAQKIYGYIEAEVIGQSIAILLPAEAQEELAQTLERLSRGEVVTREALRLRKDGQEIYVSETISPIRNLAGQIIGASTIARDVTEQKRVERELQQSEYRFTAFMDNLPDLAWMKDTLGRYVYVNKTLAEKWAPFQGAWMGKTDAELWPAGRAAYYSTSDSEVIAGRHPVSHADSYQIEGEWRHFLVTKFPVFDPSGNLTLVAGIGIDITEARRADERIRQLGAIVESSDDAIFSKTLEGFITSWNKGAQMIYGYTEAEVVGQHISILVPTSRQDKTREVLARSAKGETLTHYAAIARRKDGQEIQVCLTLSPVYNLAGEIIGTSTVARDVTEQKRVERELQESEQRFVAFMDHLPGLAWMKDVSGHYIYVNRAIEEKLPPFQGEWRGKTDRDLWPPEIAAAYMASDSEVAAGRSGALQTIYPCRMEDGEPSYFLVSKFPVFDSAGNVVWVAGMGINITEQRRADERIRELGSIVEFSGDAILAKTLEGIITQWNKGAEKIYGYTEAEAIGQPVSMLVPPGRQNEVPQILERLARGEFITAYETVRRRKDGREIQVSLTISPIRNGAGEIIGASGVGRDITEQKRVERELRETEERFREFTENIGEVFWISEPDSRSTLYVSPAYETIWGRSVESLYASPRSWMEAIHPEDRDRMEEVVSQRQMEAPFDATYRILRPDGAIRWIRDRGFPVRDALGRVIHVAGAAEDVTERRELEMQLHQVQKMDAIGQLAAGVAHDFNNLLMVISGHSELLAMGLAPDTQGSESINEIRRATELGSTAIRQLLAFSRQQILEPKILDLNAVVAEAEKMLRRLIGEDVRLVTSLAPGIGSVRADLGQLNQVILNLAVNARDAMPQGGLLRLETRELELNLDDLKAHLGARPGRYILLSVTDTGWGMAPELQARIFEPFFTNKEEGRGTGLGLSVVMGIVQQTGGHIEVESTLGMGTKFTIYLPSVEGPVNGPAQGAPSKTVGGTETVLLVEDEEQVRNITARLLGALGYRVLEADCGQKALRLFDTRREKIDLLLTDVVMPDLSGREVAEALCLLDPALKVLFHSGYTDDTVVRRGVLQAEVAFLKKPFTLEALAAKVREVLDQP